MGTAASAPAQPREERTSESSDEFSVPTSQINFNSCCLHPGDLWKYGRLYKEPCKIPLTRLDISSCFLGANRMPQHQNGDSLLKEIVAIIEQNPPLRSVKLKQPFPRHEDDVHVLLLALAKCRNLKEISLGCEHDDDHKATFDLAWMDLIQSNQLLHTLNLDFFDLTSLRQSMENLISTLTEANSLRHLCLRHCNMTDEGFQSLILELIEPNAKQLDALQFVCNSGLSSKSSNALTTLLHSSACPRSLDMVGGLSCFSPVGSCDESVLLRHRTDVNQRLINLSLVFCGLDDAITTKLFRGLEANRTLERLELDFNNITREIGMENCLKFMPIMLKHLSMHGLKTKISQGLQEWSCPGNAGECMRIRKSIQANERLLSFRLDCPSCENRCQPIFARNEIIQKVETIERAGRALWPFWIVKSTPRWKSEDVLHASTVFGILLRNATELFKKSRDSHHTLDLTPA